VENIEDSYPLSPVQQGMLFHSLYAPQSGVYIQQLICAFHEDLDVLSFKRAWQRVVERHPILRTSFRLRGIDEPLQEVHRDVPLQLEEQDWRDLSAGQQENRLDSYLHADRRRGFELTEAPLMRLALFRVAKTDYRFIWSSHHAVLDGRSRLLLLKELFTFYEAFCKGQDLQLKQPRPYRDYIDWLGRRDSAKADVFWGRMLNGFAAPTSFGVDRVAHRTELDEEESFGKEGIRLSKALTSALQSLAQQNQLTLNTLLQGAWALLLNRYSGEEEVVFGTTRAIRRSAPDAGESMVGLFLSTLPTRIQVSPEALLLPWLKEVRAQWIATRNYEHTPLLNVHGCSDVPLGKPLFESILIFENYVLNSALRAQGESWRNREFRLVGSTNYPLTIVGYLDLELLLEIAYDRRRFDDGTIARMLGHVKTLLEGMVANPEQRLSDLPLLTEAEQHQLIYEWNQTRRDYPADKCIHQLFERRAETAADQIALVHGEREVTYGELNRRSNQLSRYLLRKGIGPESLVAVCLDRSPELIIAIMAILKAGSAFVSLAVDSPAERLEYMLQDTGAKMVITREALVDRLERAGLEVVRIDSERIQISLEDTTSPESSVTPENLAYAVYTSGSTGRPKGILITHRSLVNYATAVNQIYDLSAMDRRLQFAPTSSEVFISEVFGALLSGAVVVLRPDQDFASFTEFLQFVEVNKISVFGLPSAFWHEWVASMSDGEARLPGCLRIVISGMDKARPELFEVWKQKVGGRIRWFNVYGPSEATCVATLYEADFSTPDRLYSIPIGRPIANTRIYLLDSHQNPVPVGVPGELYIGGCGVARGYLDLPELTADKFVPDTFSDDLQDRLYRTGDLARYLPDGNIEFLGRSDYQVKIRGFRVELEEIEAILRQHPGVRDAVVVAREDVGIADWETANPKSKMQSPKSMDKRLAAYIVADSDDPVSRTELLRFLRKKLPAYMIPSAFMILEALPSTPSGKVDRGALPIPDATRPEIEESFAAPTTPIEKALAHIWGEALGLEKLGVYDNFFDLGGHSLLAMKVIYRVEAELGVRLSPRDFVIQTLGQIAAICEGRSVSTPTGETEGFTQKLWSAMKRSVFQWI
jgi:surfactin family lipopeptide synthetase C